MGEITERFLAIADKLRNNEISENELYDATLDILTLTDEKLLAFNLSIEHNGYGVWCLRQNSEYLMEGERIDCNRRAITIINNS
jgi:hypothetical protein